MRRIYGVCAFVAWLCIGRRYRRRGFRNIREAIELYLEPVDDDLVALGKEVREIVL